MTDIVEKLRAEWVADVNSCPQCGADDTDQTDGLMREAANEIERLREALHEWDALIVHQYNGSREAMSALNEAGQNTAKLLYGDGPWPEPRKMEKRHD